MNHPDTETYELPNAGHYRLENELEEDAFADDALNELLEDEFEEQDDGSELPPLRELLSMEIFTCMNDDFCASLELAQV
jgi:hypothetical protein